MGEPAETLTLSDGRVLSYCEYGLSDGPVVFYFHGFLGSRLEGCFWSDAATKVGVRLIAVDRPGMGLSTFKPNRTFLEWPADVLELADHLHIQQFRLLGLSGGGPDVLACMKKIQCSRILGAAIASGLYPLSYGTQGMSFSDRAMMFMASWLSPLFTMAMEWQVGAPSRQEDPEAFNKVVKNAMSSRAEADRKFLEDKTLQRQFTASVKEAFRVSSQGVSWDARLFGSTWGFELDDIEADGLTLWHGGQDEKVPIRMAQEAAKRLQRAEFKPFDGETHASLVANHSEEILKHLMQNRAPPSH